MACFLNNATAERTTAILVYESNVDMYNPETGKRAAGSRGVCPTFATFKMELGSSFAMHHYHILMPSATQATGGLGTSCLARQAPTSFPRIRASAPSCWSASPSAGMVMMSRLMMRRWI